MPLWSGGPVNAFSLWRPEAVRVTRGQEHVATFAKTPSATVYPLQVRRPPDDQPPAARAGRRLFGDHPHARFCGGGPCTYVETVLPMRDGLYQLKDFPEAQVGGTGGVGVGLVGHSRCGH